MSELMQTYQLPYDHYGPRLDRATRQMPLPDQTTLPELSPRRELPLSA